MPEKTCAHYWDILKIRGDVSRMQTYPGKYPRRIFPRTIFSATCSASSRVLAGCTCMRW